MANKLSDLRKALLANGYSPLPGKDKGCWFEGWNSKVYVLNRKSNRYGSKEAEIESWELRKPDFLTTCVRVENGLLPIDNDVSDPTLAAEVDRIIAEVAPEVEARSPLRIRAGTPKCCWFARLEGEPFVRHGSRKYVSAADARAMRAAIEAGEKVEKPQHHHVEVFGGKPWPNGKCSRQFGAFGPHTVASDGTVTAEYDWAEGPTLADVALKDLPAVSEKQALDILKQFEEAAVRLGWVEMPEDNSEKYAEGTWIYDIDRENTVFDTEHYGKCKYAELEPMVIEYGEVRMWATFIPGVVVTESADRCNAQMSNKHGCVMITDHARGNYHLPSDMKRPTWDGKGLTFIDRAQALVDKATDGSAFRRLELTDFYAHMPDHRYIHIPTRALWPAASVNGRLPKIGKTKPATWLDIHRPVEQMTWSPGEPQLIKDRVMSEGGWTGHRGAKVFNLYRPPASDSWLAGDVSIWRNHLKKIYPDDWQEIEMWMAQRAQEPAVKLNHAMVLGGRQGIGKDTILEPLRYAIGPWNFGEVTPVQMMGRFNGFLKSVVLRVNEVRDRGETDRYAFYNHSKIMIAAPPDTLLVDMKNAQEFLIPNVLGMVITLNEKASLYLSSDDRRHFVAWSELSQTDFTAEYFTEIYDWYYRRGGLAAVAQHLMTLDISGFDAKRPPRKTPAFHEIVRLSQAPEDASMAEALEVLGKPDAVTTEDVARVVAADKDFFTYLTTKSNARKVGHRFEECGYTRVDNPDTTSGLWQVGERRMAVYARAGLAHGARIGAARARAARGDKVVKLVPKSDK